MEKFEQKQYLPEEKELTEEATEKIEIPKEDWETLKIIAKRVGGDFRMKVKLGEPGGGSFFNPEDGSITFVTYQSLLLLTKVLIELLLYLLKN